MKKHYPWLFFDADGTLFDYNRAEETAFRKTFELAGLPVERGYLDAYRRINHGLWQALERQEIRQETLRIRRFELLLEALRLQGNPAQISDLYTGQLGLCTDLIDGAYQALQNLSRLSRIAIVTNGLEAVQRSRLAHSAIHPFVSKLIISEEVGAAKPHPAFFDAAFARTGSPARSEVLIVGDSLTSDIQGGVDYGIDTCWYNPAGEAVPDGLPITFEIQQLAQLIQILE